jgi:transposase
MRRNRQHFIYEVVRRRARGESIHGISRALGVCRKTIRRILRDIEARREAGDDILAEVIKSRRAPRPSKLDRYHRDIEELLEQYPDIRATRLLEELQDRGFDGSYTIVREYLKRMRSKKKKGNASTLVVTSPGRQAQADWSPYNLADGTPYYAFSFILCHSRYQYTHFLPDMRQATLFRQLRRAFEHIGGLVDEVIFDSMPGIVDRWELDEPVLNLRAVDFAAYYGFGIHIAPRGQGKYKGKVERPFRYLEGSLLNARNFYTIDQANTTLDWWLDNRCNVRIHRATKRRPIDLLEQDRPALNPLPPHPYDDRELAFRIVDGYGYVNFDGNHYQAKGQLVGSWVYIRASDTLVEIFAADVSLVASHIRHPRNSGRYEPAPEINRRPNRLPIAQLVQAFESWGTCAYQYAQQIRKRHHHAGFELSRILALRQQYAADDILDAIRHAQRYASYKAHAIERILQVKAHPRTFGDIMAHRARERIKNTMAGAPVRQRPLSAYDHLLKGPVLPSNNLSGEEDTHVKEATSEEITDKDTPTEKNTD